MPLLAAAQVTLGRQQRFHHDMPPGDYSGITSIGNNRYLVVDDKAPFDGFYCFHIQIDTLTGVITSVENEGYLHNGQPNRDMEAIAYVPPLNSVLVAGEADNCIRAYQLDGSSSERTVALPPEFRQASSNYGLESLTYDASSQLLWTTTERPLPGDTVLRLQSFDLNLQSQQQYAYRLDAPQLTRRSGQHLHGVSDICALGDGRLLVIEREVCVPKQKIGARAVTKIYEVRPSQPGLLPKQLVCEFSTRLNLTARSFANVEGMCVAHRYSDGRVLLLLVADSQHRYKGVLRDWLRTIIL